MNNFRDEGHHVQYMLLIYASFDGWNSATEEDYRELMTGHGRLQAELRSSGEFVSVSELPLDNAVVVRTADGSPAVTTGPLYAEGDFVAGFYQVECESGERAAEIAGQLAEIEFGLIEVRQMSRDPRP